MHPSHFFFFFSLFSESQESDEFDISPPQVATPTRQPTVAKLGSPMGTPGKDFLRSPSDYFPMIRRGHSTREVEPTEVFSSGWNVEITSRKEREESLRDDAHQFELKLKKSSDVIKAMNFLKNAKVTYQNKSYAAFGFIDKVSKLNIFASFRDKPGTSNPDFSHK